MQFEFGVINMRILVEMVDTVGVKQGRTTLDTMYGVAFFQQQLSQIGTVLAGNAGD
jgi:hypothetical protein